jgi:two-component system sensor histidine kinase VicK
MSDAINVKTSIQIFCTGAKNENTSTAKVGYPLPTTQKDADETNSINNRLLHNMAVEDFIVNVDKIKISQVISNLLSNALTAIKLKDHGEEGRIKILISRSEKRGNRTKVNENLVAAAENTFDTSFGDEIIVNIEDNGIGIPPSIIPNLFSKFISGSDAGTGLGLYISKNIIEAHGGRIWACNNDTTEMTAASNGATFSFSLPAL